MHLPLEETHRLGCFLTCHTQGPLCQASPCHLLDSSPQGSTLGSRQCHLLGGGSSRRCQPTPDSEGPGTSPLPHPQPSLESETSSQMLLASAFCETPGSCERLCMKASGVRRGHHRLPAGAWLQQAAAADPPVLRDSFREGFDRRSGI